MVCARPTRAVRPRSDANALGTPKVIPFVCRTAKPLERTGPAAAALLRPRADSGGLPLEPLIRWQPSPPSAHYHTRCRTSTWRAAVRCATARTPLSAQPVPGRGGTGPVPRPCVCLQALPHRPATRPLAVLPHSLFRVLDPAGLPGSLHRRPGLRQKGRCIPPTTIGPKPGTPGCQAPRSLSQNVGDPPLLHREAISRTCWHRDCAASVGANRRGRHRPEQGLYSIGCE